MRGQRHNPLRSLNIDDDIPFPKPRKRTRQRKRLNPVSPQGKRSYSAKERAEAKEANQLYSQYVRPQYLLDLARQQGRLTRSDAEIPGATPKQKLLHLARPDEWPLCEMRLDQTGCAEGAHVAATVHHRKGREKRDGHRLLNETSLFVGACPDCHDYVERHRRWARSAGWLLPRNERRNDE